MKRKDYKKVVPAVASVVAIGAGAFYGLTEGEVQSLSDGFVAVGTGIGMVLGALGVWANTDKEDE